MKKIFLIAAILASSIASFAQTGSLAQSVYKSRVNDTTSVDFTNALASAVSNGWGYMFYNNQAANPHYDIYIDGTVHHVFNFAGGGGGGGGGDALTSNPLSQFAATTSAQLRGVMSDETGTGVLYFSGGNIGTPSAGVGTNITGILGTNVINTPAGNIAATTSQAAINELDTEKASLSGAETLTNKRITPRVQSVISSATVTPNADADDAVKITAQAADLTLANPSGTPVAMQAMIIRLKDNGTSRAITFGSQYRALGVTLPTATTISKTMYLGIVWNSDDSRWDVVGVSYE